MVTDVLLGEFFGTLILILLGNGVVAGVLLRGSKVEGGGWMIIATAWGFAVAIGVFVADAFGAPAHLNPAVTVGMAVRDGAWGNVLPFVAAQLLGAFAGGLLVYLHYGPHWALTEDADAKLACFTTAPAIRHTGWNLVSEAIGTFVLVLGVGAIFSGDITDGLGPLLVGVLVWGIGLSLGGTTGYAINPARDFAPRLAHALLPIPGKRDPDFGYGWIPIVGPLIGGAVAGGFMILFPVF